MNVCDYVSSCLHLYYYIDAILGQTKIENKPYIIIVLFQFIACTPRSLLCSAIK